MLEKCKYKFNEISLAGAYIKQLLSTFNLPKYRVYTKEQANYAKQPQKLLALKTYLEELKTKTPEEQQAAGYDSIEQIQAAIDECQIKLNVYELKGPELHVVPTIYRNNPDIYPYTIPENNYPVKMYYAPYIKDGFIQEYVDGKWVKCHEEIKKSHDKVHSDKNSLYDYKRFIYDYPDLNYTKTLQIKNNIYDTYTHEYLGDYLRFIRDYNEINLMPLYNCFSNNICANLNVSLTTDTTTATFKSSDKRYKIYMIPVKLFEKYTIAINCESWVEMFCGIYNCYFNDSRKYIDLIKNTYHCYDNLQFNKPVIYDKLYELEYKISDETLAEISQVEKDLKLFIKLPIDNKSSISILCGDYQGFNDDLYQQANRSIVNLEYVNDFITNNIKLISPLQLLAKDTGESYPFADRLIEYLVGHVITPLDKNLDNIDRVKLGIYGNDALDNSNKEEDDPTIATDSIFTDEMRLILYTFMTDPKRLDPTTNEANHDILGYVDHDVEKYFRRILYDDSNPKNKIGEVSISEIDLYGGTVLDGSK